MLAYILFSVTERTASHQSCVLKNVNSESENGKSLWKPMKCHSYEHMKAIEIEHNFERPDNSYSKFVLLWQKIVWKISEL